MVAPRSKQLNVESGCLPRESVSESHLMVAQMTIRAIIMLVATNMLQSRIANATPEAFWVPSCSHRINNPPQNRLLASATAAAPLLHFRRQRLLFMLWHSLIIFPVDTEGERRNNWWWRRCWTFPLWLFNRYAYRRSFGRSWRLSRGRDILPGSTIIGGRVYADLRDSGGYYDLRMSVLLFTLRVRVGWLVCRIGRSICIV